MPKILTINAGSSSLRFALFADAQPMSRLRSGKVERLNSEQAKATANELLEQLGAEAQDVVAVGHRIVHGMRHTQPERLTPALLRELRELEPIDPEHLPRELALIEALQSRLPDIPHVACFDTGFHRHLPAEAAMLPIPRRYFEQGVRRYGFHGLSYTYLMQELARLKDPAAAHGRVILAHLGSGASLAAVRDGRCIDTSMGFTPTGGLMMGTRSGDLDPGLMNYFALTESMTPARFQTMVNHESGLIGIAQSSADIRDLLAREQTDTRAREALSMFCYQAKKWIGAFAAALRGVDTLVFAGGIGENSAIMRCRICEGLQFLGIEIDDSLNEQQAARISKGSTAVRVVRTDEEAVIAQQTARLLGMSETGVN